MVIGLIVTDFIILSLAIWGIASLLVSESGPFDIFGRFRDFIGVEYNEQSQVIGKNEFAKAFTCIWCLSRWIAIPFALMHYPHSPIIYTLALSTGAIITARLTSK